LKTFRVRGEIFGLLEVHGAKKVKNNCFRFLLSDVVRELTNFSDEVDVFNTTYYQNMVSNQLQYVNVVRLFCSRFDDGKKERKKERKKEKKKN